MPATEAGSKEQELQSYELAFHVLPTVAEREVSTVFQSIKDIITNHGGNLSIEEAPARFDLAYEIVKYLEGRNRKFSTAYFGWVRFTICPSKIEEVNHEIEGKSELLRHLLTRLTKIEEENPFYFHEALEEKDKVQNIEIGEEAEAEVEAKENKEEKEVVEDDKSAEDEESAEEDKA